MTIVSNIYEMVTGKCSNMTLRQKRAEEILFLAALQFLTGAVFALFAWPMAVLFGTAGALSSGIAGIFYIVPEKKRVDGFIKRVKKLDPFAPMRFMANIRGKLNTNHLYASAHNHARSYSSPQRSNKGQSGSKPSSSSGGGEKSDPDSSSSESDSYNYSIKYPFLPLRGISKLFQSIKNLLSRPLTTPGAVVTYVGGGTNA